MVKNILLRRVPVLCSFVALFFMVGDGYSEESVTAKENLDKLIKTNSCRGCYLSGLNLNRIDLSDADLEGADLSKTKMYLANLSRANLRNADLRGTVFGGADLADADLRGADLRGTSLDGAYLGGTLLDGTFVTTKPYEKVGVSDIEKEVYVADQSKPKRDPKAKEIVVAPRRVFDDPPPILPVKVPEKIPEKKIVKKESYPQAPKVKKLTPIAPIIIAKESVPKEEGDAVVETDKNMLSAGRGIKNKNLAENKKKRDNLARLSDTKKCYDCDLSGMDLSNRNLAGVDLERSDLTGCNFEKADLEKANLKGTSLIRVNLRGANLKKADLYRADLTDADLTGANITDTLFDSANLSGTVGLVQ